jgi:hypothetical protein
MGDLGVDGRIELLFGWIFKIGLECVEWICDFKTGIVRFE